MPHLSLDGRSIFYQRDGPIGAPVLLLSGSLGTTLEMWKFQVEGLQEHYDIIRYDVRGHGKSSTSIRPYSIDDLGGDVVALIEELGIDGIAFCGLSIGGAIGQWLAIHAPKHFRAFILANTAAKIGTLDAWAKRIAIVEEQGMVIITESVIERWFTSAFREASPQIIANMKRMLRGCDPIGYVAACKALRDMNLCSSVHLIRTPTHILAGEHDLVTTVADATYLKEKIAGSSLAILPASHISNVETSSAFNSAVRHFLQERDVNG
ncbi:3-oxoadipate enol-lactonase [Tunturiibacter empetritectus]|uniref:3-oxoadipate enol-lactonase n=1 Tax=Tunturiibacter lichenicola TaxID=2051959 RepID=A0A852VPP0_9BACT|nr:3-oxoadipate enol-lactonase [Edaphobacter lichenicola]NYF91546.1 3-oxoadipate enol-lactonase [Edaphobacter lichenicola]